MSSAGKSLVYAWVSGFLFAHAFSADAGNVFFPFIRQPWFLVIDVTGGVWCLGLALMYHAEAEAAIKEHAK